MSERKAVFRGIVIGIWSAFAFSLLLQKGVPLVLICWDWAHRFNR